MSLFRKKKPLSAAAGVTGPSAAGNTHGYRKPPGDDTLGFRAWDWDGKHLVSPSRRTVWDDSELRVERWNNDDAVRGTAGIHALWPVPKNWIDNGRCSYADNASVVGIVERWGHYVLGEDGWRAEWVLIKELAVPKKCVEKVSAAYPSVTVWPRGHEWDDWDLGRPFEDRRWPGMLGHLAVAQQAAATAAAHQAALAQSWAQSTRAQIMAQNLRAMPTTQFLKLVGELAVRFRGEGPQRFADWDSVIGGANVPLPNECVIAIANSADPIIYAGEESADP